MQINGVLCHMKILRPFLGSYPSSDSDSDTEENERLIYLESSLLGDSSDTAIQRQLLEHPMTCIVPLQKRT